MVRTGGRFAIADLTTGTLGPPVIGAYQGPSTVLARPGGGWVCVCSDWTQLGAGAPNGLRLTLEVVDARGALGRAPCPQGDQRHLRPGRRRRDAATARRRPGRRRPRTGDTLSSAGVAATARPAGSSASTCSTSRRSRPTGSQEVDARRVDVHARRHDRGRGSRRSRRSRPRARTLMLVELLVRRGADLPDAAVRDGPLGRARSPTASSGPLTDVGGTSSDVSTSGSRLDRRSAARRPRRAGDHSTGRSTSRSVRRRRAAARSSASARTARLIDATDLPRTQALSRGCAADRHGPTTRSSSGIPSRPTMHPVRPRSTRGHERRRQTAARLERRRADGRPRVARPAGRPLDRTAGARQDPAPARARREHRRHAHLRPRHRRRQDGAGGSTGIFAFDAATLEPIGTWAPLADLSSIAVSARRPVRLRRRGGRGRRGRHARRRTTARRSRSTTPTDR